MHLFCLPETAYFRHFEAVHGEGRGLCNKTRSEVFASISDDLLPTQRRAMRVAIS